MYDNILETFTYRNIQYNYYNLNKIEGINKKPYSIRVLIENVIRNYDEKYTKKGHVDSLINWQPKIDKRGEVPYKPVRVLMQDFTGVPAVVDIASMRECAHKLNVDAKKINPLIDIDLIIDHSIQVDYFGTSDSLYKNTELEYNRNIERYKLLKWAKASFDNFKIVPPCAGICHQVNLEHLADVARVIRKKGKNYIVPDTLLGTDSHTPMINGISVLGWGVGGIEAEAVFLGLPYYLQLPEVIGVKFVGSLKEGVTSTDLVLNVAYILRKYGVVGKFIEYFGPALKELSVPDRATISNMTPEYGATVDFFPIDNRTIEYLNHTGREYQAELVLKYALNAGFFYDEEKLPEYSDVIEVDLSEIEPTVAGPSRPHDRIFLKNMKNDFGDILSKVSNKKEVRECKIILDDRDFTLRDGSVVIAAITSCTNTSNPSVMIGAGLIAKKAVEYGLDIPNYVKTSLAPGSRVVYDYLKKTGLLPYLEALKFHIVGYGCTTCIGNSGPLREEVEQAIIENELATASVLSGNRNFEARIHPLVRANFLASPMLVVIYAIAGTIDIDIFNDVLSYTPNGEPIYLKDLWPSKKEINDLVSRSITTDMFDYEYAIIDKGDYLWNSLDVEPSITYRWDEKSTYIKNPPYFDNFSFDEKPLKDIINARALLVLGDTVTTDHISPAGKIPKDYPAGKYLLECGVDEKDFNSYGSRRGNHNVMIRGTFSNVRIRNFLVYPKEGGYTLKLPEGELCFVYEAAEKYKKENTPLIVLAGKEYGSGSSRDWAAKGTALLGIKAVIAESFERIHRANLLGMGVLPLLFVDGQNIKSLNLTGKEKYSIYGLDKLAPNALLKVIAEKEDGSKKEFNVRCAAYLDIEIEYFKNGGILPYTLKKLVRD
ncbi:MAG: aconitate hydratase AcnA [Deferribacterota bacterium]|nr:aconitate hydratase AcnA [Deferribacterota bacterium]